MKKQIGPLMQGEEAPLIPFVSLCFHDFVHLFPWFSLFLPWIFSVGSSRRCLADIFIHFSFIWKISPHGGHQET